MIREYRHLDHVDIREMQRINNEMRDLLEHLDEGDTFTEGLSSLDELSKYLTSLVSGQRKSLGRTRPGSWGLVPNDEGMDSDARVEFIFTPTYLATAILSRSIIEFPLIAFGIEGYSEALKNGCLFCTYRDLQGHGYEGDEGAIDALRILSLGKLPWLLDRHPLFCPELKSTIDRVAQNMATRLESKSAFGTWGEDYSEGFRSALETLRLKNDRDFMESLREAKSDPSTIGEEGLPW